MIEEKRLVFEEDGCVLEVDVVEDTSDSEWTRLKLRQVRILDAGPFKMDPDGTEFDVCCRKGAVFGGMWTLRTSPGGTMIAPFVGSA